MLIPARFQSSRGVRVAGLRVPGGSGCPLQQAPISSGSTCRGDGNINPLLWMMLEDGVRLYGVEASDPIELVNINHYSDYLRIRDHFRDVDKDTE